MVLTPRLLADHAARVGTTAQEPPLPVDADQAVAVAAPAGAPPPVVDG